MSEGDLTAPVTPEQQLKYIDEALQPRIADQQRYLAAARTPHFTVGKSDLLYVWDGYHQQYLDFASGVINPVGHSNMLVIGAVIDHLKHHGHTAAQGNHVLRMPVEYARALSESLPPVDGLPQQVYFTASETQARELAEEIAWRVYGGFECLELVDETGAELDRLATQQLVSETMARGEAVIIDESLTGFGRLGTVWGQQSFNIDPHITVLGGSVGGGLPMGAIIASAAIFRNLPEKPRTDELSGHPWACAAGKAVFEQVIRADLLEHVKEGGLTFDIGLGELVAQFPQYLSGTRGVGLLRSLSFKSQEWAGRFYYDALSEGLLVGEPIGTAVPFHPMLITSENELRRGVDLMASVCLAWDEISSMQT